MQLTVEACESISIRDLQRAIKNVIAREKIEFTEDDTADDFMAREFSKYTINGQTFKYTPISSFLGGHRWFFLCPHCDKKAFKLFLPPIKAVTRERKYLCKACHKLKNESALVGANQLYKAVMRPLKRLKEIEDRIARGHMKAERVQALLDEHELIEGRLKESPEYRLYAFKRKHGID